MPAVQYLFKFDIFHGKFILTHSLGKSLAENGELLASPINEATAEFCAMLGSGGITSAR